MSRLADARLLLIDVQRFSATKRKNSSTEMVVTDNRKDFLFSWSYVIIESQKIGREVTLAYQRLNKIKILFNRVEVKSAFLGKAAVSGHGLQPRRSAEIYALCMRHFLFPAITAAYSSQAVRSLCQDLSHLNA